MEKLEASESLIKNLQSEVLALKAELEKVKGLNVELESNNRKLTEDLAAAEAKVVSLSGNEKVRIEILMGFLFVIICLRKELGISECKLLLLFNCWFLFTVHNFYYLI